MEKEHSQLELFTKTQENLETKSSQARPFLSRIRGHEKVILSIIGIIIIGTVSFCIGFEKGRNSADLRNDVVSVVQVPKPISQPNPQVKAPVIPQRNIPVVQVQKQESIIQESTSTGNFTIQIATYQTKSGALKEAEILKKKGFSPVMVAKGPYTLLCVGNFRNREAAKQLLAELKKRYRDCFIRRL